MIPLNSYLRQPLDNYQIFMAIVDNYEHNYDTLTIIQERFIFEYFCLRDTFIFHFFKSFEY